MGVCGVLVLPLSGTARQLPSFFYSFNHILWNIQQIIYFIFMGFILFKNDIDFLFFGFH